jgi:pimeloyl-ACP methyl ester carboxylesterase
MDIVVYHLCECKEPRITRTTLPALVTHDGRTLHWRELGSGPPLVCHPGGPGMSGAYFGDLPELAERRTLVLLDPRGTGGSDRPGDPEAYRLEDYARDLEELRRHLGLDRIDVLGHSHGGFVSMVWASEHSGGVDRLVLANTLVRFGGATGEATEAAMAARSNEPWYADAVEAREYRLHGEGRFAGDDELGKLFGRELPFYFHRWGDEEAAYAARLAGEPRNGDAMRFFNSRVAPEFDLRSRLPAIKRPVLVITGSDDFVAGEAAAREVTAGLPDARLAVLEDSAHFSFAENGTRSRFADAVAEFLDPDG